MIISLLSITKSMCLQGLDGIIVNVEVDISRGLPTWEIVGLPDANLRESKDRVKTAIKNTGIKLESKKYIINLSPANLRKAGGYYDLAIAVGILLSTKAIYSGIEHSTTLFIGELSLDGSIKKVNGIIAICVEALKLGIRNIVIPKDNYNEASVIKGINIIPVASLKETIEFLSGEMKIESNQVVQKYKASYYSVDFSEVKGQKIAKRALEICAAGGHNTLLIGPPGCGKSMMINRLPTILPDVSFEEAIEITKIQSIAGFLKEEGLVMERPFRNVHHSITKVGLLGGGRNPIPGEISLAHYGVLFLDEMLEFDSKYLDLLRIPLEEKNISIVRNGTFVKFPSAFTLVGSANPCPCGYYGSRDKVCTCTEYQRKKYMSKISGPLFDRLDIIVQVNRVEYEEMNEKEIECSSDIKSRVNNARKIQLERYSNERIFSNSELSDSMIDKYCIMNKDAEDILMRGISKLKLSYRSYIKMKKVARTIADLEGEEVISKKHIFEAFQYKK